jgi:tetratricopeptide (TPR) repeat protein
MSNTQQHTNQTGGVNFGQNNEIRIEGDLIGTLIQQAAMYQRDALHQLPSIPEHFTGRAEQIQTLCDSIRANAATGTANAITSSIQGMGGVGKTALAIVVAHALTEDFPDAQLLLALGAHSPNTLTPDQARDQVLRAFYPDARLPDDEATLWNLYRTALGGKRALLILDDARDDAHVQMLLPPAGCAAIITSRRSLETGEPLRLDVLPRPDAVALLRQLCPRLTDAEADGLAGLCGDLPVALRVAGGFLKRYRARKADDYIREVRADRAGKLNVNALFDFSYRALKKGERAAFCALSVMPADFDHLAGEAVIGEGGPTGALDELVALNLLDYDEKAERFRWHDLLRELASGRLGTLGAGERFAAMMRHAKHFMQVARVANDLYLFGGDGVHLGLWLFDRERAHLVAAFEFLVGQPPLKAQLVALVDFVHDISILRFHPRERTRWLEAQQATYHDLGDRRGEVGALANLGIAYHHLGEVRKAIEFFEQALPVFREIGDRLGEAGALINLCVAYADLGDGRKAIGFGQQGLTIVREIGDRRFEQNALMGLGMAYFDLGKARKAIEFFEQALPVFREIGDRLGEAGALANLGIVYHHLGEARRAIEFYEQHLTITRDLGDRRGEGNTLCNLGGAYRTLGDVRTAIELHEQALLLFRDLGERRSEASVLGNLGNDYRHLGEARKAIEFYEQVLPVFREIGDLAGEGLAYYNLCLAHEQLNDFSLALEYAQRAVEVARQTESPWLAKRQQQVKELQQKLDSG